MCGCSIKLSKNAQEDIEDHICSNKHDKSLKEKGLENRFYYAPGIAKREEQRKAKPPRQEYTTGRTSAEKEEYMKKSSKAAAALKQQRRDWFSNAEQVRLRPPLAKEGSALLDGRDMQEPAERKHYLGTTLLRSCFAANVTMRAVCAIVDWVRMVGTAGYFKDYGMLPSGDSLRVNVLPQIKKEERDKVRGWVKYYASQGTRHFRSGETEITQ